MSAKKIRVETGEENQTRQPADEVEQLLNQRFGPKSEAEEDVSPTAAKPAAPGPEEVIAGLKDQNLRLMAELDNFRKRTEREMNNFRRFAQEDLIRALLPALDNLQRALDHSRRESPNESLIKGVELTLKSLEDALTRFGVSRIQALGQPFDPTRHEAVMQQEDPSLDDGTILAETQAGYLLHDRLLRPALVVVSTRPAV